VRRQETFLQGPRQHRRLIGRAERFEGRRLCLLRGALRLLRCLLHAALAQLPDE
jgi:hypothetical protein